jgi:hypothetical protein
MVSSATTASNSHKLLENIGIRTIGNIIYQILTVITIIYSITNIQLFDLSHAVYLFILICIYFAIDIYIWKCENLNTSILVFIMNCGILLYTYQNRQNAKSKLKSILNYYTGRGADNRTGMEYFSDDMENNKQQRVQPYQEPETQLGDELGFDGEIRLPMPNDPNMSFIGKTEKPYIGDDNDNGDSNGKGKDIKLLNFPDNLNIFEESLDINNLVDRMKFNELVHEIVNKHRDNYSKMDEPLDDDLLNGISRRRIDPIGWDITKYYPDCLPTGPDSYSGGKDFGYCTNIHMPKRANLEKINNNKTDKKFLGKK